MMSRLMRRREFALLALCAVPLVAASDIGTGQFGGTTRTSKMPRPAVQSRPHLDGQGHYNAAVRSDLCAMGGGKGGWAAAGWLGGLALGSEVLQVTNTVIGTVILYRITKAATFADLVEVIAERVNGLGLLAIPAYVLLLHSITILPVMSAIMFIVLAGTVFGAIRGTIVVSLSLSSAAAISAIISRRIAASRNYSLANLDERAAAVDAALARKPVTTTLLLVTLLRLSPVLPFTFSNYLAGITSINIPTIFLGTLLGTLPTQAIYVSAGALGRKALQGGVTLPKSVMVMGVVATGLAILLIGHVASQTIKGMDLESSP